jgi:hypothetical protein
VPKLISKTPIFELIILFILLLSLIMVMQIYKSLC